MIRTDIIRPVPELLRRDAEERGDHVAVSDATREVSYADLWERTANLAGHFRDAGVRHGDAVVLLTSNDVALVESYLAVTREGGVGVCLSPQTPADDIGFFLEDTSPRAVIVSDAYRKPVADALREQGQDAAVVSVGEGGGGTLALEDLARARPPVPPPDDLRMKEPAWILYTSGTTGRPKGVVLSQHGMLWVAAAGWLPFLDLGPEDYVLCPLPLFHSYPLDFLLAVLAVGGREHIMERFSTEQALRLLHEEPFTMLLGVPTTFSYLAEGYEKSGPAPRGTLRVGVTAGAIMLREIWERTERALGAPVVDAYGATETSTAVTISPPEGTHEPGTGGVQILGFGVRVVDPASGKDVASGEEGELIVRGPGVMLGYHAVRRRRGTLCATAGTAPEISLASTMSAS